LAERDEVSEREAEDRLECVFVEVRPAERGAQQASADRVIERNQRVNSGLAAVPVPRR
jgi:hypothetical protein